MLPESYGDLPVIVVTDEFRAEVEVTDFTHMTDDEFADWLLARAINPSNMVDQTELDG